ncbi:hypothetical protein REPUB_Repub07fG0034700 [Reevesia pubescens]
MLQEYLQGKNPTSFMYPSGVDQFRRLFACLEEYGKNERGILLQRKYTSLPRERVYNDDTDHSDQSKKHTVASATRATLQSPTKLQGSRELEYPNQKVSGIQKPSGKPMRTPRRLLKSNSISASRCVGVIRKICEVHNEVHKMVA